MPMISCLTRGWTVVRFGAQDDSCDLQPARRHLWQRQRVSFAPGALVRARGREWVVLPDSTDDLLVLRPLGGGEDETAGVLASFEPVEPAEFSWPDPDSAGDDLGARLLHDAARLGFRSSAGPFRSFGEIAVEPRPYQLVPLLMGLRLDPGTPPDR